MLEGTKKAGEALKPHVAKTNEGSAALLGALVVLSGLLAALGITSGAFQDMARSHRLATIVAFACVISAYACGAVAAYIVKAAKKETKWLWGGFGLLWVGLLFAIYAGVSTWGDRAEPSIVAAAVEKGGRTSLHLTVKDNSLSSNEHVIVSVIPLKYADGEYKARQSLYAASFGPDGHGEIGHSTDVPLPLGDYTDVAVKAWVGDRPDDCWGGANTTGCVTVHVSRKPEPPQLVAAWHSSPRRLSLTVAARYIPGKMMRIQVRASAPSHPRRFTARLAKWVLAPDRDGNFVRSLLLPVSRRVRAICVVATTKNGMARRCPPGRDEPATVWTEVAVPTQKG